jgi:co-chaperonin GroES (HSP10)
MTKLKKNKTPDEKQYPNAVEESPCFFSGSKVGRKHMRKISPLGMRVLVKLRPDTNVSEGGLYLPEGAKQAMSESLLAEVMEVAIAHDDRTEEEANISGVPLGSLVLIPKQAGIKVPWDQELRIIETKEILALVNEIDIV